jgi:hypothetical protein
MRRMRLLLLNPFERENITKRMREGRFLRLGVNM